MVINGWIDTLRLLAKQPKIIANSLKTSLAAFIKQITYQTIAHLSSDQLDNVMIGPVL